MMDICIECICCQEIEMMEKMSENDTKVSSIIYHEGFEAVCLNRWSFKHLSCIANGMTVTISQFMSKLPLMLLMCLNIHGYRQLTGWCWGWLERKVRVVLPNCAVKRI